MGYYFSKEIVIAFDEAVEKVKEELHKEGFSIMTDIDVKASLKKELDVDIKNYRILGTCNPPFAYKALQAIDKIGVMLPCNVIVQEKENGTIEVAAINPLSTMPIPDNENLKDIADLISTKLQIVVKNI